MTDLEITKLCAEAMGWDVYEINPGVWRIRVSDKQVMGLTDDFCSTLHDPLHDDAQAMALVKKFEIMWSSAWSAYTFLNCDEDGTPEYSYSDNLNRAICECAAKMQQAKDKRLDGTITY